MFNEFTIFLKKVPAVDSLNQQLTWKKFCRHHSPGRETISRGAGGQVPGIASQRHPTLFRHSPTPHEAARWIIKRPAHFARIPAALCVLSVAGCQQWLHPSRREKESARDFFLLLVRIQIWGGRIARRGGVGTIIMHTTSHTTCAIRSVNPVQMSSLRVAGVPSASRYPSRLIVPPDRLVCDT